MRKYSEDLRPCWNTVFQWRPPIFPKITWDKNLYDQGREPFHLLVGEAEFETGEGFLAKLSEATGAHLTGTLGQGVCMIQKAILRTKFTFAFNLKTCKFRTKWS